MKTADLLKKIEEVQASKSNFRISLFSVEGEVFEQALPVKPDQHVLTPRGKKAIAVDGKIIAELQDQTAEPKKAYKIQVFEAARDVEEIGLKKGFPKVLAI